MYRHHAESIEKLKQYFLAMDGLIAIVLDGSVVKGNARADSDIDAVLVVTDEKYSDLKAQKRIAEVISGFCTYEGGYFDVKYKTKNMLRRAAERASEPTRSAYVKAQVIYSVDEEIASIVEKIAVYPDWEAEEKISCFNANLQLNRGYFLHCVGEDNAYMRAHLAQEIVYSVYRLILLENRVLFSCNRRLEETVLSCSRRPENILELGRAFLEHISTDTCEAFVGAFKAKSGLSLTEDISENCSQYVKFYEDWWLSENPPFPNEW
ncbi:MAG: nucleotidyltransferase domain-containing protein [Clostridia bacterium]|nr:nucleotidyltransferase domain-containing protein [Clostridia bacterium]